jgi:hypothetical protein
MPLTCIRAAMLALVVASAPLGAADAVAPSGPESALLPAVKALRDNDFKALFATLPPEQQTQAQAEWKKAQATPDAKGDASFDRFLGQLLDPNAVDNLMAQAEPQLKGIDLVKAQQGLMALSGMLPLFAQQGGKPLSPDDVKGMTVAQGLLGDVAAWIPKSGITDAKKLREAIEHLVAGAKKLGVKDAKELHALAFDEALGRLGPMLAELKGALAVYDLQADQFLDSVKAAGAGDGDQRTLNVSFTAFAHPYEVPLKVQKVNGAWVLAKDPGPSALDTFKGMLPALPLGGGDGEGAGEVK